MQNKNVVVTCPPCGENVAVATKRGFLNKESALTTPHRPYGALPPQVGKLTARGFTLIELLVVVLIIGILAAVAVPQYQKAVDKSKAASSLHILKAIKEAQEVYYLANGHYAIDFKDLDVSLPGGELEVNNPTLVRYKDGNSYSFYVKGEDGTQSVKIYPAGLNISLEYFFDHHTVTENNPAGPYLLCGGFNQRGVNLCLALGGTWAVTGSDGTTQYYFL